MTVIPVRDSSGRWKISTNQEIDSCIEDDLAFSVSTGFLNVAVTTEVPFVLCKCPDEQLIKSKIQSFCFSSESSTTRVIYRVYKNPTITEDGTALPINNLHLMSSQNTAILDVFKLPTISANGTFFGLFVSSADSSTGEYLKKILIDTDQNILVTAQLSEINKKINTEFFWEEF